MFRAAGIYAQDGHSASRFVDLMVNAAGDGGHHARKIFVFPAEKPRVAAIVATGGNPPVQWASRSDGSFAILDGEIYNAAELRSAGGVDGTDDAETLLALYSACGREAMARVQGAMSLVIWDAKQETLLAFRDRRGVVPSFFAELPDAVAWASDIWSLLRAGASPDVHRPALDFFLGNGFVPSPWTIAGGVRKLPPAHLLLCSDGHRARLQRYWLPAGRPRINIPTEEVVEHLGELLEQSLHRRWTDDEKAGVLLSGGVDSKLVVAGLTKWLGVAPKTFTFRYTDYEGAWNEGDEARRAARHFGVSHEELIFRPSDVADHFDWMVESYGEPFTHGLHSSMLHDVVEDDVSALYSGATIGYLYPTEEERYGRFYAQLPRFIQRLGEEGLVPLLRRMHAMARPLWLWRVYRAAGRLADDLDTIMWLGRRGMPVSSSGVTLPEKYRAAFYRDPSWAEEASQAAVELFNSVRSDFVGASDLDKITFLDFHFRAPEGTMYWSHWWSCAHGLAMRFPYCDDNLLDFALRLPRTGEDKDEIRELAATVMPRDLAYVPKVFQTVPIRHWIRGPLRDFFCDQLSPDRVKASGLFNNEVVQGCIQEHLRGENDHAWKLWAILTVMAWQDHARAYNLRPSKSRPPKQHQANAGRVPGEVRDQADA